MRAQAYTTKGKFGPAGVAKVTVSGTLGEILAHLDEIGRDVKVQLSVSADVAHNEIAPRASGKLAEAFHKASIGVDPVRESRKRQPRGPKVADDAPASAPDLAAQIAQLAAAVAALSAPAAAPKAARKPRATAASKRDAQIADVVKATAN